MYITPSPFSTLLALIMPLWGSCESNDNISKGSLEGSQNGGRVINGSPADIKRYPYIVEIQHYNATGDFWYFRCVGSIMNANTILTACHCIREEPYTNDYVKFKDLKDVRILAGVSDRYLQSKAQIMSVKQFFPHPLCKSPPERGYNTDVAVVILESNLALNEDVKRVKIVSKDPTVVIEEQSKLVQTGAQCSSMGWGLAEAPPSTKSLDQLQMTTMHLVDGKECSQLWCKYDKFYCNEDLNQYNYVCAISSNSTMCRGDSGGPLICNDYLFGVDNLGDEQCRFEVPTIFADMNSILYFLDFF